MNQTLAVAFVHLLMYSVLAFSAFMAFMAVLQLVFPNAVKRVIDLQRTEKPLSCPRCGLPTRHFQHWEEVEREFQPHH